MNGFRWTLADLHKAERAFDRHRAAVEAGTYDVTEGGGSPGCDRACSDCHVKCSVIVGAIETIRHGLATQARQCAPTWKICHAGRAYDQTAGRA